MDGSLFDASVTDVPEHDVTADAEALDLVERIDTGGSLIVLSWPSARVAAILASCINRRTAHGKNVVILSESLTASQCLAEFDLLLQTHAAPFGCRRMVRRDFLGALDGKTDEAWFDHLDLVLIPRVEDSLRRPFEWEHLCYRIMDRCTRRDLKEPQVVLMCSPRNHAEGALRRNFPIFELNEGLHQGAHVPHESALSGIAVKRIWWTLWAAEDVYADSLLSPRCDVDYGVEGPLGYYVGLRRVSPSHYQIDPGTPTEDQLESLQNRLDETGRDPWSDVMQGNTDGAFMRTTPFGGEALRDPASNPWRALRALAERGGEALLVNLVLPPTALRTYLIANAAYFGDQPLEPLTPRMQRGVFDAMTQIYLRLAAGSEIDLKEVRRIFLGFTPLVDEAEKDPFLVLRQSFESIFGHPVADRLKLGSSVCWQSAITKDKRKTFRRRSTVSLYGRAQRVDDVPWLDDIDVVDERNDVVDRIRRDHVHQTYVEGHVRVLAGKLFRIDAIDEDFVRVSKTTSGLPMYRPSLAITLTKSTGRKILQSDIVDGPGYQFRRESFQVAFQVHTAGWWFSTDFGSHWRYTGGVNDREYRRGRALRIALADRQGKPLWSPAQLMTLALWINEVSITLFPESHRFLIAAAHVGEGDRPQAEPAADITPRLSFSSRKPDKTDAGALWIFEDSNADLGIVGACWDRAEWLLELCLDYLNWRLDEVGSAERQPDPCHLNRYRLSGDFLAYGAESADPAFDFAGLRDCLVKSGLVTSDHGITEQRRRALSKAVAVSEGDGNQWSEGLGDNTSIADNGSGQQCDFCGKRVGGEQGQVLQDGRFRCLACGDVAVDKLENARNICDEVREVMRAKFGVEFRRSIDVSFVTAATIAGSTGETFVPTGEFDSRAVGLAVSAYSTDNGTRFMVFVEHGHSRQNTAMTFAHEFTHIWQYERLDYQRMEEEHGKLLIEGHASWVELAVGRMLAERVSGRNGKAEWGAALKTREVDLLGRSDEYGVGYRLLLDMGGTEVDGFELLGGMYRKSG